MRLRREEDGVELKLSQGEASLLTRVLTNYLPDLREEVYKTENYEWRESLKADEVVLKSLIARLEQLVQASPADRGLSPSAEGSTES
jgi:hypothetical protein